MISVIDIEMKLWQISVPVSIQNSNDFAPYFTYKMAHGLFKMVKSAFLYDVILKHIILNSSINTRTTCIYTAIKLKMNVWTQISSKGNIEDFAKMLNRWHVT